MPSKKKKEPKARNHVVMVARHRPAGFMSGRNEKRPAKRLRAILEGTV